jgi:Flp pilus assembly protein TadG
MTRTPATRPGVVIVETAVVLPVLLFILLAIIIGGTGVFRYQQVACQAREAARWTSVRGADYQRDSNLPSPTSQQVVAATVQPMALGMDPNVLAVRIQWIDQGTGTVQDWDAATKDVRSISPLGEYVNNAVRVTVTYQWNPGLIPGTITLQSISQLPMSH